MTQLEKDVQKLAKAFSKFDYIERAHDRAYNMTPRATKEQYYKILAEERERAKNGTC